MEKTIDNLDRKILEIVMRNARIPSKDIALVCGVSRAAVHQRIQRMIDIKVITGSGYNVDPKVLGYTTCTYVGVNLERGALYRDVVPELEKYPKLWNVTTPQVHTQCSSKFTHATTNTSWTSSTTAYR